MEFREYQTEIIKTGTEIVKNKGFVYLTMEVRTGKTLTSLGIADKLKCKNVLFITKKKAISSIESDYSLLSPGFTFQAINYESIHKLPKIKWDMIICDEAHSMGAYPKPSKRAKQVKELLKYSNPKVILLSGTPTPESYSQMYHQVYGIQYNPFSRYKNFYRFCDDYVNVTIRPIGGMSIRQYGGGKPSILEKMQPYTISYTQAEAGFKVVTTEKFLTVKLEDTTYSIINTLKKNLVVQGKEEVILGDTAVKLMSKIHQLYSGTVKFESGNSKVLDLSKARYIKEKFNNKKIGIFYKFKAELDAIKEVYKENVTTDLDEFNSTNKSIALQIVSGREGISLRKAECLVYYNIDFSATSYWQSRDRMTTKDRLKNNVYWIFAEKGIEQKIYKAVSKKKDYTLNHFKRDFLSL
jgi:hypothetical protein|tara:strand:- start:9 stop:1238 length:1230 start_codon:yes stop_codon:yes gene_type:complete